MSISSCTEPADHSRMRTHHKVVRVIRMVWVHPANRGRRVGAVLRTVAFHVRGRAFGRRTLVTLGRSSRIWAEVGSPSSSSVIYGNLPDWEAMWAWARLLKPGDLFLDVGANVGVYTLWAAELGARVISVEPDPDAFGRLVENVSLNNYSVSARNIALASEAGIGRLTTGLRVENHLTAGDVGRVVEVATLDSVLGGATAMAKIDVEGAELQVLHGARRALHEGRIKALQLEWNMCSAKNFGVERSTIADLLKSYGFKLFRPNGEGRLESTDGRLPGEDVFALLSDPP